jgi:hypothetical protein
LVLVDGADKDVERGLAVDEGMAVLPKGRNEGEGRGEPKLIRSGDALA